MATTNGWTMFSPEQSAQSSGQAATNFNVGNYGMFGGDIYNSKSVASSAKSWADSVKAEELGVKHVDTAQGADQIQADITRAQWEDFQERYIPVENDLLALASTSSANAAADDSGNYMERAFANTTGQLGRQNQGLGAPVSARTQAAMDRQTDVAKASGIATAENLTRRAVDERNLNLMGDIIGIGKGINSSASNMANQAGGLATQRKLANDQISSQNQQSALSGALGGAAMGFQMGGPVGAGIGAIAGYALS